MFSLHVIEKPAFFYSQNTLDEIVELISKHISVAQNWTLNIVFLDPFGIQNLNKNYRNIDKATDVLSFHYHDDFSQLWGDDIAGELIFCEEKIVSQWKEYGLGTEKEFYKLVIHSVLHILWFDHEDDADYEEMKKWEDLIWNIAFVHRDKTRENINQSNLSSTKKKELYRKMHLETLNYDDYNLISEHQKKPNTPLSQLIKSLYWAFQSLGLIKYLIILFLCMFLYTSYTHPGWIKIRAFPLTVWKIRTSLHILKSDLPEYYALVQENTDEINVDYIDIPANKWWHAFVRDWNRIVRIFNPWELETPYLTQLLVHEACHWHQWTHKRFGQEDQQKLENECQYLWIYVVETLFPHEKKLLNMLYSEATSKQWTWGDGWKNSWENGDSTQWLSILLPEEKIIDYTFFWDNYAY